MGLSSGERQYLFPGVFHPHPIKKQQQQQQQQRRSCVYAFHRVINTFQRLQMVSYSLGWEVMKMVCQYFKVQVHAQGQGTHPTVPGNIECDGLLLFTS